MSRFVWLAVAISLCIAPPALSDEVRAESEEQKELYNVGRALARSLQELGITAEELPFVVSGLTDGVSGTGEAIGVEESSKQLQTFARRRQAALQKTLGAEFAKTQAAEPGAVTKESGMIYRELAPGQGDPPTIDDSVEVHYTGTLIDGTVFDSSVQRGQPATFQLKGVIPCFSEGIREMRPGGKARLVCPSDLAYGDGGSGGSIRPGATLVFEVELLRIVK
jgi:FKBP-type peptidyl-prolyl cis-trans isomerase